MTQQIRTLATIGLPSDVAGLMPPMLRVLKGRTQYEWCVGEPPEARVVLLGPDAVQVSVEQWVAQGKLPVEVNRPGERRLGGIHSMELPVRMFALLSLLNDIEPLLVSEHNASDRDSNSSGQLALRGVSNFVEAFRALCPATAAGSWLRSGNIYVRDDGLEFALHRDHFEALQSGQLVIGAFEESLTAPPGDLIRRPVEALAWYAGWACERLLPDLDANALFRLRRWPDFGTIGSQHHQIRLAAMLAGHPWSRDALTQKSGLGVDYVTRFFNAAAVAGLLEATATSTPPASRAAQPASGLLASIVRGVRLRLGLGV